MSVCICIKENELENVAESLNNKVFKYKFLMDSDDKYKTIQEYNLQVLDDCLMFSGSLSMMKANRWKTGGEESIRAWKDVMYNIFNEERHVAIVNDFFDNPNMVLVFPITFHDSTQRSGADTLTLADEVIEQIINNTIENLINNEGMNAVTFDSYSLDTYKEMDPESTFFKMKQQLIRDDKKRNYREEILSTFIEAFKFRMITYYTKLRDYGLDDIMRKLNDLGYLDERFNNELYLYEEEARRLLAKRLCALSYKHDIKLLIDEGILKEDKVSYNLYI